MKQISQDIYEVSSVWYYHAILELTHLDNFIGDMDWIAKQLSISVSEIKMAVETLCRLDLLKN